MGKRCTHCTLLDQGVSIDLPIFFENFGAKRKLDEHLHITDDVDAGLASLLAVIIIYYSVFHKY